MTKQADSAELFIRAVEKASLDATYQAIERAAHTGTHLIVARGDQMVRLTAEQALQELTEKLNLSGLPTLERFRSYCSGV